MKKVGVMVFVSVCVFALATVALAQNQSPQSKNMAGMTGALDEKKCPMMEKNDKGMRMHGMMSMMMPKQIVASNDGGVIVLAGNKLYKYDKNLALVKEVEVKVDAEAMDKMMADMKARRSMMKHDEKAEKSGDIEEPESGADMGDMSMPGK